MFQVIIQQYFFDNIIHKHLYNILYKNLIQTRYGDKGIDVS